MRSDMRNVLQSRRGFTLIEILIVLAISMILMGLVLYPVVQSFSMMRRGQAMADAQDTARQTMEQLSREIGEAMFVYDNTRRAVTVLDKDGLPNKTSIPDEGPVQLPVRQASGQIEWFVLANGKMDLILPKITMHCLNPAHDPTKPRDYPRGDDAWPPCPVCHEDKNIEAKPTMPLQRETTVVRYFLGLRYNDPTVTSSSTLEPDEGLFGWQSPYGRQTVAGEENQVVLYRAEFDPSDPNDPTGTKVNPKLFPSNMTIGQALEDPIFFYRPQFCREWAKVAQVVGMGRYEDLVNAEFNSGGDVTSLEPCVTFRFAAVDNDAFTGTYTQDKSSEYPDAVPMVYRATYGYWTALDGISVFRDMLDSNNKVVTLEYVTKYVPVGGVNHLMIMRKDESGNEEEEFDISDYLNRVAAGTLTSLTRPNSSDAPEMAFIFDYGVAGSQVWLNFNRGMVNFSLWPPKPTDQASVAVLDPLKINNDFLNAYEDDRGSARRMATLPTFDKGNPPDVPANPYYVANTRMVPGSERVVGPDMTPPMVRSDVSGVIHYKSRSSTPITYTRVPLALGDPGPNQYKIDYDTGAIYFSSAYDQHLADLYADNSAAKINVDYRICFNLRDDVVKGSYTTRDLVNVHLQMKMFDPDSGKPHAVDLNNTIKVRNAAR